MNRNIAWHFVGATLRDGQPIPADDVWLEHKGDMKMCESGLHFSQQPYDALQYAPGETLCLVEYGGIVDMGDDKGVCSRRRIIARMDATELLYYFARQQALSQVHLWDAPDVVLDYLMGDDAARAAARAAARDAAYAARAAARAAAYAAYAARDAASDAARAAARAAARDAAYAASDAARDAAYAARDAASDAASDAARAAARAAARDAAYAASDAARDAAYAARDAASDAAYAARELFNSLVFECFADFL